MGTARRDPVSGSARAILTGGGTGETKVAESPRGEVTIPGMLNPHNDKPYPPPNRIIFKDPLRLPAVTPRAFGEPPQVGRRRVLWCAGWGGGEHGGPSRYRAPPAGRGR